ncbi:MAG: hypothetical protein AAB774_01750 [Patescibacteria group bacterium]
MDLEPGNYLYIIGEELSEPERQAFIRCGYEELLELQVVRQSQLIPIKGHPHLADLTARHFLANLPSFSEACLIVVYTDHHARMNQKVVVEYRYDTVTVELVARKTGAVRDTPREDPNFF